MNNEAKIQIECSDKKQDRKINRKHDKHIKNENIERRKNT